MPRKTKIKTPARIATPARHADASHAGWQSVAGGNNTSIKTAPIEKENILEDKNNIFDSDGELVVDVFETNSDFVVLTAIAGVQIKDIDISVEKEMMVIKGQRGNPHEDSGKKYFYQECYWGPFSRKIVLPENINTEDASAQIDKGILTIKIPKIKEA